MRVRQLSIVALLFATLVAVDAQTSKKRAPAKKAPAAAALTRVEGQLECGSDLGIGVKTRRRFCDVMTGRDPKEGVLVTIPPHRGPVMLSFELHNRHMYSEELIKAQRAFRLSLIQDVAAIGRRG